MRDFGSRVHGNPDFDLASVMIDNLNIKFRF
jgi:hypothetical protein